MLPSESIARLSGYGRSSVSDVYRTFPQDAEGVESAFELARRAGRQVVLRGAGRSYGDAAHAPECLLLDFSEFNRTLSWDQASGIIEAEPGSTIEDLWRTGLPDGWWPPVVSGTMYPTLGGALAMNIHGKNAYRGGTLGEHILEIDVVFPNGDFRTLKPSDDLFFAVISSAGLLGAIVRVRLQMKRVESGLLDVYAETALDWPAHFAAFERHRADSDYMVSWVDAFGDGRGLFHAARHVLESDAESLRLERQDLPERILGILPKNQVWRVLRAFTNRAGMRTMNSAKHASSRLAGNRKTVRQSLVAFSFLLDYVPGWEKAYGPSGFIQYQSFIPEADAMSVFREQFALQRAEKLENFLSVMKRHRADRFLFSHGVEGYSLAMDFPVPHPDPRRLEKLCHRMNDLVLQAGGKFYFAKDSTLRPADLDAVVVSEYRRWKQRVDPGNLLTSGLAKRTGLDPN